MFFFCLVHFFILMIQLAAFCVVLLWIFCFTFLRVFPNKSNESYIFVALLMWCSWSEDVGVAIKMRMKCGLVVVLVVSNQLDFHYVDKKHAVGWYTSVEWCLRLFVVVVLIADISNRRSFVHQRLFHPIQTRQCPLQATKEEIDKNNKI